MSKDTGKKQAANKDPLAGSDSVAASEDARLVISAAQLLANDSDRDDDKLKITSVGAGVNCSVSIDCNGKIVVDPMSNFSGVASFSYTVSDGRGGFSTATVSVNVGAKADAASLAVTDAVGSADTAIALNVNANLTDTDGSETLKVVIGGVPPGATLNHGTHNANGTWTLTKAELAGLTITPPTHSDADFNLTVKAISTESSNGSTATTQQTLHVVVNAPAAPVLVVQDAAGNEDSAIALNITASGPDTTLVTISGVPTGATLNHGTQNPDGSWTVTKAQLAGLTITPAHDSDADFDLRVSIRSASSGHDDHDDDHHDDRHGNEGLGNGEDAPPPGHSTNQNDGTGTSRGNPGSRGGDDDHGGDDHDDGDHHDDDDHDGHDHDDDDDHGTTITQTIHVTITAVADLPALSVMDATGNAGSAIALDIGAALTDTDGSEALSIRVSGLPDGATLSVGTDNHDGTWTLTSADLSGLQLITAAGTSGDFNLTVEATSIEARDSSQSTNTATIHLHLDGGALPIVAVGDTDAALEDSFVALTGNVLTNDTDPNVGGGAVQVVSPGTRSGTYGTLTLNADGTYSYVLNNSLPAVQALAEGQQVTEIFAYQAKDQLGATSNSANLVITVTGTNDAPTLSGIVSATTQEDNALQSVNLLAGAGDVDSGAVLQASSISGLPQGVTQIGNTLVVDPTNAAFQHLALGATQVLVFNYNVNDGLGGSVAQTVTITIAGSNDAPTVSGSVTAAATEAGSPQLIDLLAGAHDADDAAVLHVSTIGGLPAGVIQAGDMLVVDPTDAAFRHLAKDATQVLTINYNVVDGLGGSVAQSAQITITGVNNTPTVSGIVIGAATEDGSVSTINLLAGAGDVDDGAVLLASSIGGLPPGVTQIGNSLVVDPADVAFQHIAQDAHQLLVFNYSVSDQFGASVAQTILITVTGSNDRPTVSSIVTGAATEDGAQQNIDLLAGAQDADDGAVLHASIISGLPAGVIQAGDMLIVDPTNAAFQQLAMDETQLLTINYNVVDQFGGSVAQTAQITVTGVNDDPLAQNASFTSTEDSPEQSFDLVTKLSATDIDNGDVASVLSVSTISGALSYSVAGGTITIDPSQYNALAVGEDGISDLLVTFQDTQGATATAVLHVDIRGINDLPVAQDATVTTNENALVQTVSLASVMSAIDVDSNDALAVQSISLASVVLRDAAGNPVTNPSVPLALSNFAFTQNLVNGTISFDTNQFNALPEYLQGQFWTTEAKLNVTFTDGHSSVTRTLTVDVDGRNDAVVAQDGRFIVTEDDPYVSQLDIIASFRVIDPDFGDTVTIDSIARPSGGLEFAVNPGNTIDFDPNQYDSLIQGQQAATVINVTFSDSAGRLTTLPLTVEVRGINDAPVAQSDSFSVASGAALVVGGAGVLANDDDVENSALYAVLVQGPAHGSLTLDLDGSFTYVADAGYEGTDGFTYLAYDNLAYSAETAVAITVTGVNFAAEIGGVDSGDVQEDGVNTANGLLTISDLNPGQDVFSAATYDGTWGSLALDATGNWTYTLDNFVAQVLGNGEFVDDAITITSIDGTEHIIVVAVAGLNDAPVAGDDVINLPGNVASTISIASLLETDSDIDGSDWIQYVQGSITVAYDLTPGDRGTVVEDGLGNLIYTPPDGFGGDAVFSYRIADPNGVEATGTVHLSIGVNHNPVVVDDAAATQNGDTVNIAVLANDYDPDTGETLTLTVTGATGALHGDVVVNPDGTIDYTPFFEDYSHDDSFQYTVVDAHNAAGTGTVIIFNNAAPQANDDLDYQTDEDVTAGIDPLSLLVNDSDPNGDLAVISGIASNSFNGGTVTFDGTTIYYTPTTDFNGSDSFEYTISDGYGGESIAFVYVNVVAQNDAPSPSAGLLNINEDEAGSGFLAATDPENDTVHFALSTAPGAGPFHGTVVIADDGTFTYTPDADYSGSDQFWFTASDDNGGSADNFVDVQITARADAPFLIVPSSGPVAGDEMLLSTGNSGAIDLTPAVATFASGEFISVWVDLVGNAASLVSQRFAADGTAIAGTQQVIAAAGSGIQNVDPRVLSFADDSYVVTWTLHDLNNGNATDVWAQRYDDTGALLGSAFQVDIDPTNALREDRQALLATVDGNGVKDGGFTVTWNSFNDVGQLGSIEARTYNASGTAGSQVTLVGNSGSNYGFYIPAVAAFADGSFIEAWQATNADGNYDVFARIFAANGTPQGDAFVVSTTSGSNADSMPSVAVLEGGDAIIAWSKAGGQNGTDDIVAQRIGSDGAAIGDMFTVSTDQGTGEIDASPVVVARPGGGFVVTYETLENSNNAFDISAQLYGASGERSGNEFTVSVDAVNGYDDRHAAAALTSDGGFVVAWDSVNPVNGSTDVTARLYGPGEGLSGQEDTPLALFPLFAALNDIDGSELLSVTISNVPTGAVLSAGTDLHNGSWLLTQADMDALSDPLNPAMLTFTAPLNESGNYTLTATAESLETANGDVATTTQSFSFIIAPVNDDPVSQGGEFEAVSGLNLIGSLVAADVDDSILVYGIQSGPLHGQLNIDPNSGIFNYASNAGYFGDDSFTFAVSDNNGGNVPVSEVVLHVMPVPTLLGDIGDNILTGSAANDVIVGGLGNDVLTGGGGTDVFVFGLGANDGQDMITDFDWATGVLEFKDVLASGASNVAAIDALIAGIVGDGAVGTRVDFDNGASIDFSSIAYTGQLSIADLLQDASAQLLVSHG